MNGDGSQSDSMSTAIIRSMPNRIRAVIRVRGGYKNYWHFEIWKVELTVEYTIAPVE